MNTLSTEPKDTPYKSFLLRVWQEGEAESSPAWHGEVESIQTGQKWEFGDLDSLFEFLRNWILEEKANQSGKKNVDPP